MVLVGILWVILGYTRLNLELPSFTVFELVLLSRTGLNWVLPSFTWFEWVFTTFYWVRVGCYLVVLDLTCFHMVLLGSID